MKPATIDEIDEAIAAYRFGLAEDLTDNAVKAWVAGDMIGHKQLKIPINMGAVHKEALRFGKIHGKLLREEGATIIKGRKIPWLADSVESTRAQVVDVINQGIADGLPMGDITGKKIVPDTVSYNLRETLIRNKDFEYVRIARTETGRYQNKAAINRYEINGIKKVLVHDGHDFDAACAAADQQIWTTEYAMNHELEHPNCFIDRQIPIFTSNGWVKIGDIIVGDLVLTHNGRFRKVSETFKMPRQQVNVVKIGVGESRTTRRYITVTDEHPIMLNGGWVDAKNITLDDYVSILAKKCEYCDTVIPWWRTTCSVSCGKKENMLKLRDDPVWMKKSKDASKRVNAELNKDPERRKRQTAAANVKTRELVKEGTHSLQQYENHVKSNQSLARNKYRSFLEKKMEWLLNEMDLKYKAQPVINRPETVINNISGGMRQRYYKPDFILTEYNIIIECDGDYWHDPTDEYEIKRQEYLESLGYVVLRFSQSDIRENLAHCAYTIKRVLMNHNHEYMFLQMKVEDIIQYSPKKPKTLYNLSVDEDESFIAKGFVVHNCTRAFSPVME